MVSSDVKAKQIVLRFVKSPFADVPKDKSLELWSIAKMAIFGSFGLARTDEKAGVLRISFSRSRVGYARLIGDQFGTKRWFGKS